jgi:hypothetical protein
VIYQIDCCQTKVWVGIREDQVEAFRACDAAREPFPYCGCLASDPTTEDARVVAHGNTGDDVGARCIDNACMSVRIERACGDESGTVCVEGEICVARVTVQGAAGREETTYDCAPDPCAGQAVDCTCGADVCAESSALCNSVGTESGVVDLLCESDTQ